MPKSNQYKCNGCGATKTVKAGKRPRSIAHDCGHGRLYSQKPTKHKDGGRY